MHVRCMSKSSNTLKSCDRFGFRVIYIIPTQQDITVSFRILVCIKHAMYVIVPHLSLSTPCVSLACYLRFRGFPRLNQSRVLRYLNPSYIRKITMAIWLITARQDPVPPGTVFPSTPLRSEDGVQCSINMFDRIQKYNIKQKIHAIIQTLVRVHRHMRQPQTERHKALQMAPDRVSREKRIGALEETSASSDKDVVKSLTFV